MNEHGAPWIACAVCGCELDPQDVVIVTREVVPAWATSAQQTTTVVHRACEIGERRADHTWSREPPQTLARAMTTLAVARDSPIDRAYAGKPPQPIATTTRAES